MLPLNQSKIESKLPQQRRAKFGSIFVYPVEKNLSSSPRKNAPRKRIFNDLKNKKTDWAKRGKIDCARTEGERLWTVHTAYVDKALLFVVASTMQMCGSNGAVTRLQFCVSFSPRQEQTDRPNHISVDAIPQKLYSDVLTPWQNLETQGRSQEGALLSIDREWERGDYIASSYHLP